ncbi:MAG TPA: hypothetical protein DEA73_01160 [Peptococcaceae bacterium]|nr:hypothetical protein [Peptococcaceae bacterium]
MTGKEGAWSGPAGQGKGPAGPHNCCGREGIIAARAGIQTKTMPARIEAIFQVGTALRRCLHCTTASNPRKGPGKAPGLPPLPTLGRPRLNSPTGWKNQGNPRRGDFLVIMVVG